MSLRYIVHCFEGGIHLQPEQPRNDQHLVVAAIDEPRCVAFRKRVKIFNFWDMVAYSIIVQAFNILRWAAKARYPLTANLCPFPAKLGDLPKNREQTSTESLNNLKARRPALNFTVWSKRLTPTAKSLMRGCATHLNGCHSVIARRLRSALPWNGTPEKPRQS
jgi:hypothetical protein